MKLLNVKAVDKVVEILKESFQAIERSEKIELVDCIGRVIAEDIYSPETIPPFNRSSVDGYAVKAEDTYGASESLPAMLEIKGIIKMGEQAGSINIGEAKYIPTGGMLPENADSVVMVEYTEKLVDQVMIYNQVGPSENVIYKGDDVKEGDLIIRAGTILNESSLGVLASMGKTNVLCYEKPLVGIISTGDELVPYDKKELKDGQIRDINSLTIESIAKKLGADVIRGGIISDDLDALKNKSKELFQKVDMLIFSGGSSVGTLDYTKQVIDSLGVDKFLFEGVSVKPGKPTLLAQKGNKVIWGLPGHPVSAMMIFKYFGEKLINILKGSKEEEHKPKISAILTRNVRSHPGRTDWVRVKLKYEDNKCYATPVFGKSGIMKTLLESQGYVEIKPEKEGLLSGTLVDVVIWD